jgi:hypothetical protein
VFVRAAVSLVFAGLIVAVTMLGCAGRTTDTFERRIELHELAPSVEPVEDDYRLLGDEETAGRFGCGLALAKFALDDEEDCLDLSPFKPAEEAYWTDIVCGTWPLRDLQFLSPINVRPDEPQPGRLCAAADVLGASLLLVYAPNRYGPNAAQVLGVLYDVPGCRPIAVLHASARFADEHDREHAPDRERGDQRPNDAYYQACRQFEDHFLRCLTDVIRADGAAPTTQPHRWTKPPDRHERWWNP